jgi:hypothetical protein
MNYSSTQGLIPNSIMLVGEYAMAVSPSGSI